MKSGIFITIEGIDGVGKTTQSRLLKAELEALGKQVVHSYEPGGTAIGQEIRKVLLNPANSELHSATEALLYAADRAQHVNQVILPGLQQGKIVLCERYVDSSLAYQGYGLGGNHQQIRQINNWATGGLKPDITLYLDLDPMKALKNTGGDRIEQRDIQYYQKVREGFYQIAKDEPDRFFVISAEGTIPQVFSRVRKTVFRGLSL